MDLKKLKFGKVPSPPLIIVYGGPGIGKTAFGIGAEKSTDYKIGKENHVLMNIDFRGADRLECNRMFDHQIDSIKEIQDAFKALAEQEHSFDWLIIDDLSSLEEILVREVCKDHGVDELKKIEYAKGYEMAKERWHKFLSMILELQETKSIGIILIAHTKIENIKDPMSESYAHHDLQLDKRSRDVLAKKVDLVGFAHKKVLTKEKDAGFGQKETIAVGESSRVLTFSPDIEGFTSKDRFGLPGEINLDWTEFEAKINDIFNVKKIKKESK